MMGIAGRLDLLSRDQLLEAMDYEPGQFRAQSRT